jgi:hypothetical protein
MAGKKTKKALRISAMPEKGFWRAGVKHTRTPCDHDPSKFTKPQIVALKSEPMLRVEDVDVPDESDDDAKE